MLNVNEYFNGFNIRIVGTKEVPMFYAPDIGDILGIEKIRNTIKDFGPNDLVSAEIREQYKITTYRADGKKDNRIHLLTLQGVIRLINISRKAYAEEFRKFVADLVNKIRLEQQTASGIALNQISDEQLKKVNTRKEVFKELETARQFTETDASNLTEDIKSQIISVQTHLRPLYVFECECNPNQNQQYFESDSVSDNEDSDIDDPDNIIYILKQRKLFPNDTFWEEQLIRNEIDIRSPNRTCYLITTDYTKYYMQHKLDTTLYCVHPEKAIKYLRKEWNSFVGSSQKYTDRLLLTMEKGFLLQDLRRKITNF